MRLLVVARPLRIWEPGVVAHVVARAHSGAPIFASEEDRRFVLLRAARIFAECGLICVAWAILINHLHLVVLVRGAPARAFQRLFTAIAGRVRLRAGGRGAVFQDRYYRDLCDDEASLLERMTYVLGNPLHHRVVPSVAALIDHEWSGLGEILGNRAAVLTSVGEALQLLDPDPEQARVRLLAHLGFRAQTWCGESGDPDAAPGEHCGRVLADADAPGTGSGRPRFVHSAPVALTAATACGTMRDDSETLRTLLQSEGWTPAHLIAPVCALTAADPRDLASGRRTAAAACARAILAYVACDLVGCPMSQVASLVGVGPTALVDARARGRRELEARGAEGRSLLGVRPP